MSNLEIKNPVFSQTNIQDGEVGNIQVSFQALVSTVEFLIFEPTRTQLGTGKLYTVPINDLCVSVVLQ